MKTEGVSYKIDDLKENLNSTAGQLKDFAAKAGNQFASAYENTRRGMQRIKNSAEDVIADARHEIKEHPVTIVAGAALGAFAIGVVTGWIVRSRRRS